MKKPSYNELVFINCPFDDAYLPLLRATVYTVYRCGFFPVSALADNNALENRIDKIFRMIEQCRYGIHDISRIELSSSQLPRFNMPFELGLFFGASHYGNDKQRKKNAMVFEGRQHQYRQYLSDISGIDIWAHNNDAHTLIRLVRNWLAAVSRRRTIPHAPTVISNYDEFILQLPTIVSRLKYNSIDEITFNDYCQIVEEAIKAHLA
jgi:hypothetical protein